MSNFKYSMHCRQCGEKFKARRSSALFCDGKCRVAWHREHKESNDSLINPRQAQVMTKSLRVENVRCSGCNAIFSRNGNNSMRKYCTNACAVRTRRLKPSLVREWERETVRF